MTETLQLFHLSSAQVYRCKNSRDPLIMIFSGGTFSQQVATYFEVSARLKFAFSYHFFSNALNFLRLNSRRFMNQAIIYFRAYWFVKVLVVYTPVWMKNGITHSMYWTGE